MSLTFFFIYKHNMFCVCGSSFNHAVQSLQGMGGGPLVSFPNAFWSMPSLAYQAKLETDVVVAAHVDDSDGDDV